MEYIIKKDGYVWSVSGRKGFEIYFNMGKDPDDPRWKPKKKRKKTKKEEDI
jgi:ribosomal protein L24E